MELKGSTALVTGANGFVGTYVTQRLLAEGLRVRAWVRRPEARPELERMGAEVVLGELTDAAILETAVRGARWVVHCAATGSDDLTEARRVNTEFTERLTTAALAADCERFVHISTIAVYELQGQSTVVEDSPRVTTGRAYSVTKAEAERAVEAAAARGLRTVILRPGAILGVHPTSTWGTHLPTQIRAGQFPQVGDGQGRLGYLHISSLTEAVVLALREDAAVGQAFTLVDGDIPVHRYTDAFATRPLPSVPPEQAPSFLSFHGQYSTEKAQRVLGFVPRDVFDSSMAEILAALPRQG
ncbi:NAD-dependent epimerase/dehydratase family protein [Archangium violaceum]|uniref:NAD-dependent epimerase/dehydratase family protein n=1 Tax=Archangium violaceum TaxID=83451 RepID=UPI00193B882C|nr:NAD-dependent epimerase/dehydratase family protein [Archangium violaceum]QRK04686.1 NAD-dependent epimerase/dehydratase family protein [Archangium violaceum]